MTNLDANVATFDDDETVTVTDRWSPTFDTPSLDTDPKYKGTDDIITYSGFQTDTFTYFCFTKKLNTSDEVGNADCVINALSL